MAVHLDEKRWWARASTWGAGLALVVVAIAVGRWFGPSEPGAGINMSGPADASVAKPSAASFRPASGTSSGTPLVEIDMLGSRMDVSRLFQLGFGGGLNLDSDTRSTLDTLLLQMPDPPSPPDLEKLEFTLRQGLPKEEAEKAMKLFQSYRSYQSDLRTEANSLGIPDSPKAVDDYYARVAQIQRRHFDDTTAAGLFGQEMRAARAVMLATFVEQDQTLTLAEKKQQLDALRQQLPPDQREVIPEPAAGPAPEGK